jgi:hypothetical protein
MPTIKTMNNIPDMLRLSAKKSLNFPQALFKACKFIPPVSYCCNFPIRSPRVTPVGRSWSRMVRMAAWRVVRIWSGL